MLDRTAGYRHLSCPVRAVRTIDQDVCGRRSFGAHIALDVTACDMDISNIAGTRYDAAPVVIADVTACYVRLVQVDVVVINTYAAILVNMTIGNYQVAIIICQVDAMQGVSDMNTRNRQLHSTDRLDADRLRMDTFYTNSIH